MANEILGLCSFEAKKLLTQFKNAIRYYDSTQVLSDEWEQAMIDYKDIYLKITTFIGDLEKQLEQSKPRIDLEDVHPANYDEFDEHMGEGEG